MSVLKNDHFLVFLGIWVLFPKFLGRNYESNHVIAYKIDLNLICY